MIRATFCPEVGQDLEISDVALPPLGHDHVRVRTDASGICHTDLAMKLGLSGLPMPRGLGHEGAGTVVGTGAGVSRCKVGDRVILSWAPNCGTCWHCVRHEAQHCESFGDITASKHVLHRDGRRIPTMAGLGTFSEMMQVSELSVVPVRTGLPGAELAMIGCGVTTGVGAALWTAQVRPGATVAVFGLGGVGLSVVQGCRIAGAAQIIVVDPLPFKRETSLRFGATTTVDPAAGDPVEQIKALTAGRGVDFAFEVTGIPDVLLQAYGAIRKTGAAIAVGMPHHEATAAIPLTPLFFDERRILGCLYGSAQVQEHFPMLVDFAERGKLDLGSLVSTTIDLGEVNDGLTALSAGERLRTVITFS